MATLQPLGIWDPFVHPLAEDPSPAFRELRERHPVYYNEVRGCWVVSRFEDVQAISRDVVRFTNTGGVDFDMPADYLGKGDFLTYDPPDHTRLRKVLQERFSPRHMAAVEPLVRDTGRRLVATMAAKGGGDASAELAFPLPELTILALMGFPERDRGQLQAWMNATSLRTPGSAERPPECDEAHEHLAAYTDQELDDRAARPRDDLMTVIANAVADGRMTREETHGMALLLLTAGWETTASLISTSILMLHEHRQQRAAVVADPLLASAVVEEVLRAEAPVQYLMRTAKVDVELHGTTIPQGAKVLLLYAAANRDDRRWENPDAFDIARPQLRHVAFGEGIHHCLGAPLARLEARIAIQELLAVAPEYRITGEIERLEAHVLRGIHRLPVTF